MGSGGSGRLAMMLVLDTLLLETVEQLSVWAGQGAFSFWADKGWKVTPLHCWEP